MSIFHLSVFILSREKNNSALTFLSDLSGVPCKTLTGNMHRPKNGKKADCFFHLIPEGMPPEFHDPVRMWHEVELENLYLHNQMARCIDIAFPKEFSKDLCMSVIRKYVQEQFVDEGMAATVFCTFDETNPHCIVMLTLQKWHNHAFEPKYNTSLLKDENDQRVPKLDEFGNIVRSKAGNPVYVRVNKRTNDWSSKESLLKWRQAWETICNEHLPEDLKISAQASDRPYVHVGALRDQVLKEERIQYNKQIARERELAVVEGKRS